RLVRAGGVAVIDVDHDRADTVVEAARGRGLDIVSVGRRGNAIRLIDTQIEGFAQIMRIAHGGREPRVRLPLVGGLQVEDALVAAAIVIATGGDPATVF